ncbi:MAG TPA: hypothetical protein VK547_10520, partial [Candidatus Udaeobacter sp.]|nr:hypothetical protein [Candidatus Udaeobacter sp.]
MAGPTSPSITSRREAWKDTTAPRAALRRERAQHVPLPDMPPTELHEARPGGAHATSSQSRRTSGAPRRAAGVPSKTIWP